MIILQARETYGISGGVPPMAWVALVVVIVLVLCARTAKKTGYLND